jgi:hypothetical protein
MPFDRFYNPTTRTHQYRYRPSPQHVYYDFSDNSNSSLEPPSISEQRILADFTIIVITSMLVATFAPKIGICGLLFGGGKMIFDIFTKL